MDQQRLALIRCGEADGIRRIGTGYLIAPRLVLTARHVVVDKSAAAVWQRIDVRVGHPQDPVVSRCTATVEWTHPEDHDVALLLLAKPIKVPGAVKWGHPVGKAPLPYDALGYPRATVKSGQRKVEHLRGELAPLSGGHGVQDLYTLDQGPAPAMRADGKQAWSGASGSAVFCRDHLVGVVIHDDDAFENRRLHACPARIFANDTRFAELLQEHGDSPPRLAEISAGPPSAAGAESELDVLLRCSAQAVANADIVAMSPSEQPLTLSQGMYVRRQVETRLLQALANPSKPDKPGVMLVRGEAGHGKTSLMWGLYQELRKEGRYPVLIRANDLLAGLRSEAPHSGIEPKLLRAALADLAASEKHPVLLIDTLDLLLHSDDTQRLVVEVLTTTVDLRIPTAVTCRPVEARLLEVAMPQGNGAEEPYRLETVALAAYNEDEWRAAVNTYSRKFYTGDTPHPDDVAQAVLNAASRGRALREVCANPFALRLLFEVYAPDMPDEDVDTPRLYDDYWQRRVISDQRARRRSQNNQGADLSTYTEATGRILLALGRLDITRAELETRLRAMKIGSVDVPDAVNELRSRGVVTLRQEVNRLWFFHQTFFEHAAARGVLSCGTQAVEGLFKRVTDDPGDLFFGEVASEALLMADRWPGEGTDVTSLLRSWLASPDPALVALALPIYAKLKNPGEDLVEVGRATLRIAEPNSIQRFLTMLPSVVHPDPGKPFGDLVDIWQRPDSETSGLRRGVLEALSRLASTNVSDALLFLRANGCLDWLRQRPVDNRSYNEYPYSTVLAAVASADPEDILREAAAFAHRLASARNIGGLTDLMVRVVDWCDGPWLARRAAKRFLPALQSLPRTVTSVDLERVYARLFLRTRPKTADAEKAVRGLFEAKHDHYVSPLSQRAVLRGWTAAVLSAPESHAAAFLEACLASRRPDQQVAVCNAVLTEALIGQADRFVNDALGSPPDAAQLSASNSYLTKLVANQCREALRALPYPPKGPDGVKSLPWLMRKALQDANASDEMLCLLLPTVEEEAAERYWLMSDAACLFLVNAAAGGHQQAQYELRTFLTDSDKRRKMAALPSGSDTVGRIGGDLQRKIATRPELMDDLLSYARSTSQPELITRAISSLARSGRALGHAGFTEAQWTRLAAYRRHLVQHREPRSRRHGYRLWQVLLEAGCDSWPTAEDITNAVRETAAQDLREAMFTLIGATVRARQWGHEAVPLVQQALQPLIDNGASQRASGSATRKVIAQEATARRLLSQTYANLGDLDEADYIAPRLLKLATGSRYDVTDEPQRGFLSTIIEPYGFLIDRMIDHDAVGASELLVMAARALHEVQPENVKWKREIARTWTGTVLRLTAGLTGAQRQSLAAKLMDEPGLMSAVLVQEVEQSPEVPRWVRDLLNDTTVPSDVRTRLLGTLALHSRQGHAHAGWPELLHFSQQP
ncbi:serine protease [Streptomyces cellulosae]